MSWQSTAEKNLVHSWCIPGALLVHSWCTPGALLVHSWCTPGALLVHSSRCTPKVSRKGIAPLPKGSLDPPHRNVWIALPPTCKPERELHRFRKEASILRTETFGSPFRQLANPKGNCPTSEKEALILRTEKFGSFFANLQTRKGIATRAVSSNTRTVFSDTRAVSSDTRAVSSDTRAVSSDTRAVPSDSRAVSYDTRDVSTDTRLCLPTRELSSRSRGNRNHDCRFYDLYQELGKHLKNTTCTWRTCMMCITKTSGT